MAWNPFWQMGHSLYPNCASSSVRSARLAAETDPRTTENGDARKAPREPAAGEVAVAVAVSFRGVACQWNFWQVGLEQVHCSLECTKRHLSPLAQAPCRRKLMQPAFCAVVVPGGGRDGAAGVASAAA